MPTRIAALGEQSLLEGFTLAGAGVYPAETDEEVRRAWAELPEGTGIVLLTPRAAEALGAIIANPHGPLTAVLPS
ncbi:V-type ATP synthase subunit F [Cryobacterium sp. PH31-AA6]|uniref:V-type ATP synthase subunit F n=1 Tax=Cryobacterium sp. PH31-AA6 TaxID=3046205 RepID=UPI0024B96561|nr:V-type ATP synthase subunit F [Cryobacterium sp. PH31-AA6]MDJ0322694.1 V-type ATP synthase subunit F [Cryobacterium sp. PH31-AA6]